MRPGWSKTSSLGFKIGGAYNELSDARQVAQALERITTNWKWGNQPCHTLQNLVYHYDDHYMRRVFRFIWLNRFAREHVRSYLLGMEQTSCSADIVAYADRPASYYSKLHARSSRSRWIPRMLPALPRFNESNGPSKHYHRRSSKENTSWLMLFTACQGIASANSDE